MEKKVGVLGFFIIVACLAQASAPAVRKVILSDVVWVHEGAEEPYGQELILKITGSQVEAVWQPLQPYPEPVRLSGTLVGKKLVLSGSSGGDSKLLIEGTLGSTSFRGTIVTDYGTRQAREKIRLKKVPRCWFADRCGD